MLKSGIVVVAATCLLAVGGCSSGSSGNSSAASQADVASVPHAAGGVANAQPVARDADVADTLTRQVISTGRMSLESGSVATARKRVLDLVEGWRGTVSNEQAESNRRGAMTHTHLVIRVPSSRFDAAMAALAGVAHVVDQSRSAEDVTTKVIDTAARVQAKKRAVQQLERLLDRAATLGQVIRLEGDISDRQAELESLQRQQRWLHDQTSMSTITLDIDRTPQAAHRHDHTAGLFAGLAGGWHALGAVATGLLTAVGAALPFAVVIAVVGVPVWLWRRRSRRQPA